MDITSNRTRTYEWNAPLTSYDIFHEIDGKTYLQSIIDGQGTTSPMSQTMGMRFVEVDDGYAVYTVEPAEYHYNPIGSVHGGLAATLFDTTLASAIISKLPVGKMCITVELHVHYLRALTMSTGTVRCEANAIHVGRKLATAEGKLIGEQDGKIYGHSTITCLVASAPKGDISLAESQCQRSFSWEDPLINAKKAIEMEGLKYIEALANGEIPLLPIAKNLGLTGIHHVEKGKVRFGTELGGWQMNIGGMIHGGLTATLCDSALGCAIHTTVPQGMAYTTSELNVNFVRPVSPQMKQLYADGVVLHSGRQIATAEAKVVDDEGTLYAHATTTCLVFPRQY